MSRYHFMLIVSTVATLGSLYFSEIRGFIPCPLCWWQRLFMYTTAIYLLVSLFRNRPVDGFFLRLYTLLGFAVAAYHVVLERLPDGEALCTNGCLIKWVNYFGFLTIPMMSLIAFTLLVILAFYPKQKNAQ
ncbi:MULTISPECIES: disulfide bond formation protein B [Exiguobacterium]|uniref:disulfide bond formation protein B n=1 Tax=Exiguobacterium TaxID=33986 RepID=UPI00047DE543|nr:MULTISPECIES: disulfide bond formation protein B [Exiguobacterium]MCK2156759.1 disulfide bond formation protein B [Exiguobacterium sp. 17-1]